MALTFNGTSSKLVLDGAVGAAGITAYPCTVFCWVKVATPDQNGFPFCLQVKAADASNSVIQSMGGLYVATSDLVAAWRVGDYTYPAGGTISAGTWYPLMITFTAANSVTVRLGALTAVTGTVNVTFQADKISVLGIGNRHLNADNWWKGDLACVALWSSALGATEYTTLAGGAVPSTVASGSLIDYWSLLSAASTQTGVNGRVLTATSTTTAASHPITEGGGDTTPPTLSSPTGTGGTLTGSGTVSTNEANGTLWWKADGASTATDPGVGSEAGAGWASQTVSATGTQTVISFGALSAGTAYSHYLHVDAAGNRSTVADSASFTVAAAGTSAAPARAFKPAILNH